KVGVLHVMDRLSNHQGVMKPINALIQFFAGAWTILCGLSMGREGPAIHLGAAVSSGIGKWLNVPNQNIRLLVGCGTAAAISASFNTPIAGVIFAMEVVVMEYTVTTFTPIILASVSAVVTSRLFYGNEPTFNVPLLHMNSLLELPYLALMGVVLGGAAALLIFLSKQSFHICQRMTHWKRFALAGGITGALALIAPQILGIGYDTVNDVLAGQFPFLLLIIILSCKLLATSVCVGAGLPGGLIGPTLFMGASLGGIMGIAGHLAVPDYAASTGFYAIIGMAAMMGAVLQAPLAALLALLEMTSNPNIILPGLLVVVISSMIVTEVFNYKSLFLTLLQAQGLDFRSDPLSQWLYRVGISEVIDRRFIRHNSSISSHQARVLMENAPYRLLIDDAENTPFALMPTADMARYVSQMENKPIDERPDGKDTFDLLEIPANRKNLAEIDLQATLRDALDLIDEKEVGALYINRITTPKIKRVYGIVTRKDIERYYSTKK
ncbi:MAG: chloride channel protein, partial [Pseudomonadales bacterium]|nr:chloride channel protein [Pseudomonadales bacterium]